MRDLNGKRWAVRLELEEFKEGEEDFSNLGMISANSKTRKAGMLIVDQKVRCIPKSYQVSSEAKNGFFETDKVFIKKINPSVAEL